MPPMQSTQPGVARLDGMPNEQPTRQKQYAHWQLPPREHDYYVHLIDKPATLQPITPGLDVSPETQCHSQSALRPQLKAGG